jgi:hypothetical protein
MIKTQLNSFALKGMAKEQILALLYVPGEFRPTTEIQIPHSVLSNRALYQERMRRAY